VCTAPGPCLQLHKTLVHRVLTHQPYTVYAENLRTRLQYAHDLAVQNGRRKAEFNKKSYDAHTSPGVPLPGDCVLLRNLSPRGKTTLEDRWEHILYTPHTFYNTYCSYFYPVILCNCTFLLMLILCKQCEINET